MSVMFEVYYRPPADHSREAEWRAVAERLGGRLDFREDATAHSGICLTFEFDDRDAAESAAGEFRRRGEHVEGPTEYAG